MNPDPALTLGAAFLGLGGVLLLVRAMLLLTRRSPAVEPIPRVCPVDVDDFPRAALADGASDGGQP